MPEKKHGFTMALFNILGSSVALKLMKEDVFAYKVFDKIISAE